jgi:hypothetical protein
MQIDSQLLDLQAFVVDEQAVWADTWLKSEINKD